MEGIYHDADLKETPPSDGGPVPDIEPPLLMVIFLIYPSMKVWMQKKNYGFIRRWFELGDSKNAH